MVGSRKGNRSSMALLSCDAPATTKFPRGLGPTVDGWRRAVEKDDEIELRRPQARDRQLWPPRPGTNRAMAAAERTAHGLNLRALADSRTMQPRRKPDRPCDCGRRTRRRPSPALSRT